ncbi:MAG: Nex18 symbiotically induced protein [Verrucomicrobia bacterium]|nr:MAG: Nex18 symbiotically induced protein [Verrucomicrobiota bacterium]
MKKNILLCTALLALAFTAQADDDIIGTARSTGQLNTCMAALNVAGKAAMLKEKGPYTVFAPTDEAFGKLPPGMLQDYLKPENKEKLGKLLTYHILNGAITSEQLTTKKVPTVNGATLDIKVTNKEVMVNDAHVTKADVKASNGVIHVIDKVLLPPSTQ